MDERLVILCPFNSISVILGQWVDDNGNLCAMKHGLGLSRFYLERCSNSGLLAWEASA